MRRNLEEINTGSMADIAFLLLIFFLVVTTIDSKKGIAQELPPDTAEPKSVPKRNILTILVNYNDDLLVEDEMIQVSELKEIIQTYAFNPQNDPNLPDRVMKNIPGLGDRMVSEQVISLQNDMGTTYGIYVQIHGILLAAFKEMRNEASIREFGDSYEELKRNGEKEKVMAIRTLIPMIISEPKPVSIEVSTAAIE